MKTGRLETIAYLITMATESEETGLCNNIPQDDIAVLATGGKDSTGGTKA
jgi:hypothetical protein